MYYRQEMLVAVMETVHYTDIEMERRPVHLIDIDSGPVQEKYLVGGQNYIHIYYTPIYLGSG